MQLVHDLDFSMGSWSTIVPKHLIQNSWTYEIMWLCLYHASWHIQENTQYSWIYEALLNCDGGLAWLQLDCY